MIASRSAGLRAITRGMQVAQHQQTAHQPCELIMTSTADNIDEPSVAASDASALADSAAKTADPGRSTLGRAAAAVSAVKLGARVLPAGMRLFKRYPIGATLVVGALVWALFAARAQAERSVSR